jgi:alkylation response protein AidB-like acyl-CoA dehydrogenase
MMTESSHYQGNLRDVLFQLFEVLDVGGTTLGKGPFASMDEGIARDSLAALEKLCVSELQKSFYESDRVPLTLDDQGNVTLPEGLRAAFHAYYDADAHRLFLPENIGGMGAPPSIGWGAFELIAGANATLAFYLFGSFMPRRSSTASAPLAEAPLSCRR